jgi:hypothetical protein
MDDDKSEEKSSKLTAGPIYVNPAKRWHCIFYFFSDPKILNKSQSTFLDMD